MSVRDGWVMATETGGSGARVYVNLATAMKIKREPSSTRIHWADGEGRHTITVVESPDELLAALPLASGGDTVRNG